MKKLNTKKGFSLIELLVVIAIIGVLSAVGITAYTGYTASAKEQAARTQFAQMVSFVNAEIAKCALGTGNYNWPSTATKDTCSDGIDANTDDNIADQLVNGMGFKNPYDQTVTLGTADTNYVRHGTDADANADGKITIFADATNDLVKITQRVVSGTVLSQTINTAD